MLLKHLSVSIINNKVISKQNGSTPGIYKIFNVKPNTNYKINLLGYTSGNSFNTLWISTIDNELISNNDIIRTNELIYRNKNNTKIKIGILFKRTKINQYYTINDILIEEINEIKNEIIFQKVENEGLYKNYYYDMKSQLISKNQSISIVIPCHYKHFSHIYKLLETYNHQTLLQKELIIVLSEYHKIPPHLINKVENEIYNYELKIIKLREKSPAGKNRYLGSKEAVGDIIIFQDADDLPHTQRNEIIKKCFDDYPSIVHLLHGYSRNYINRIYETDNIPHRIFNHNIFLNHKEMASYRITNGNIAIRKEIVDKIRWELKKFRGQDVALNKNIYRTYGVYLVVLLPLYIYREHFTVKYAK
jgi:hypothetical protein